MEVIDPKNWDHQFERLSLNDRLFDATENHRL